MAIPRWAQARLDQWRAYGLAVRPSAQDVEDFLAGADEIAAHVQGLAADIDALLPVLLADFLQGRVSRPALEAAPGIGQYLWPEFEEWYALETAKRSLRKPKPYHLATQLAGLMHHRAHLRRHLRNCRAPQRMLPYVVMSFEAGCLWCERIQQSLEVQDRALLRPDDPRLVVESFPLYPHGGVILYRTDGRK